MSVIPRAGTLADHVVALDRNMQWVNPILRRAARLEQAGLLRVRRSGSRGPYSLSRVDHRQFAGVPEGYLRLRAALAIERFEAELARRRRRGMSGDEYAQQPASPEERRAAYVRALLRGATGLRGDGQEPPGRCHQR
jgi:hypothetical protein